MVYSPEKLCSQIEDRFHQHMTEIERRYKASENPFTQMDEAYRKINDSKI